MTKVYTPPVVFYYAEKGQISMYGPRAADLYGDHRHTYLNRENVDKAVTAAQALIRDHGYECVPTAIGWFIFQTIKAQEALPVPGNGFKVITTWMSKETAEELL